jgi:3-oxoacyl-[acyl-carrier-protein] synthase-3
LINAMPLARIKGIRLAGVASAVPASAWDNTQAASAFGTEELAKITRSTGVKRRQVSSGSLCASDLCEASAQRLIAELGWEPESIELLIFVSQTPDHVLPATSCTLHHRLGLSKSCATFDISMGCSGYVYGLWMASSLMAASGLSRGLLLVGDTIARLTSPMDRATSLLFGDAGTATALVRDEAASDICFSLGTDGSGWKNLIVPAGGCRTPKSEITAQRVKADGNNQRGQEDLFMDGAEIFAFTLGEVPPLVAGLMEASGWTPENIDAFVFHQANKFMLNHLGTKMGLPMEKVPLSLADFGNTSGASIPVTMTATMRESLTGESKNLLMAGFGVGYSWAGCTLTCGPLACPPMIFVEEKEAVA